MMQLNKLLTDDDAISPVIGIILMVAITVILAAVIASFVLGFGGQEKTPTASFSFDYETIHQADTATEHNWGKLRIEHDGGDSIAWKELYVRGNGFNGSLGDCGDNTGTEWEWDSTNLVTFQPDSPGDCHGGGGGTHWDDTETIHVAVNGTWPKAQATGGSDTAKVVAGDFIRVAIRADYHLTITYQSLEGDSSATLSDHEGPAV